MRTVFGCKDVTRTTQCRLGRTLTRKDEAKEEFSPLNLSIQYSEGVLSRDTLPIQNLPCLCPELPLYPSTPRRSAKIPTMPNNRFVGRNIHFYDTTSREVALGGLVQNDSVTEANFLGMIGMLLTIRVWP